MTDYERGFSQGETAAWLRRHDPLPPRGEVLEDRDRGYWDARLPRSSEWERTRARPLWQREAA
jgi:hypothetical protein